MMPLTVTHLMKHRDDRKYKKDVRVSKNMIQMFYDFILLYLLLLYYKMSVVGSTVYILSIYLYIEREKY